MTQQEPLRTWMIDDTGFLKQGKHSVGVQRQYTGSAGKITNCQIAVSLSVATRSAHVPIDFALYLPESWTGDPVRREECKIPKDVVFKTKHDLALEMITRAVDDKVPGDILLADSGYGDSHEFRETVRMSRLRLRAGDPCDDDDVAARQLGNAAGRAAERARDRRGARQQGVSPRHLARRHGRRPERQAALALRLLPREGRPRRRHRPGFARAALADRRMARRRGGADASSRSRPCDAR